MRIAVLFRFGLLRLSRGVPDLVFSFLLPAASIGIFAAVRFEGWIPALLLSGGIPLALMCGYDYGRAHETGIARRLAVCGLSDSELFGGLAGSRLVLFPAVMLPAFLAGGFLLGPLSAAGAFVALVCGAVTFPALGLLLYRCSGTALGVLTWGPAGILLLALPLLGPARELPGWIVLVSPVSAILSTAGGTMNAGSLLGATTWTIVAAAGALLCTGTGRRA